jgi:two-component system chemotaxis response regulator CheB
MTEKIRVLVVDDSSFMRSMLPKMLEKDPRFEVAGTAENGQEAVEKVAQLKPHVVTLDIEMPVMDGLTALRKIMAATPVPVIMVSTLTEAGAKASVQALQEGAVDFLPKALESQDKNVFRQTELLHDKVAAAASVRVGDFISPVGRPAPVAVETPSTPIVAPTPTAAPKVENPVQAPARPASPPLQPAQAKLLLIGASTGGPRALQDVLPHLPADFPLPVVVVQHMPPKFTTALAERLHQQCQLGVCEVQDRQLLKSGVIYIAPGGKQTRLFEAQGQLVASVKPDAGESAYRPSVEVTAASIREVVGGKVLAVMLTGMGEDGVQNYTQLRQQGAHIIAQDEATSAVYGMPRAVVAAGAASEQLPLKQIASRLTALVM